MWLVRSVVVLAALLSCNSWSTCCSWASLFINSLPCLARYNSLKTKIRYFSSKKSLDKLVEDENSWDCLSTVELANERERWCNSTDSTTRILFQEVLLSHCCDTVLLYGSASLSCCLFLLTMVTITWCSTTFLAEDLRYCVNRQAAGLGYDSQLLLECDRMETPMTLLASQARSVGLDNFVLMWDRARQRTSWMRHEHTCDDPCNRMTGLLSELYKSFDDLLLRLSLSPWRGIFNFRQQLRCLWESWVGCCFSGVCGGGAVASFCFFFFGLCLSHAMPSSLLVGEEQPEKIAFAPMATFLDKVMLLFLWLKVNRQRKDTWTFVLNCDHQ